ncbi:MAG: aspartate-semialdehyde dehydrogenase [Bacteroidia bacterium]|nr:aspartate-semialdehyde dehydrogenase [Bacteroidia bacterium]MDW8301394.1 aspartate-semialdehyde dehydrogenase [Bacteroidia bacterium]
MKVAVVGCTGLVGSVMLKVLSERKFPVTQLFPVASEKSVGKSIEFGGNTYSVIDIEQAIQEKPDLALFSAGSLVSKIYAPKFASVGTRVIDNSSYWRMEFHIPLIVPEINADVLTDKDFIIANPNCSTIQMVMVLNPLHLKYTAKRVVVSTYQSVSGTGAKAIRQLENERQNIEGEKVYPYPIDLNCLPHIDVFLENGYTKEEMKMINETQKIMRASIQVTATTVRVPVRGGHSESVYVEFENEPNLDEVRDILSHTSGVIVQDNPFENVYPMPLYAEGKDEVFVGRIRKDLHNPYALNMWIVADNLRKGAATNAVQIAQYLLQKGWLNSKLPKTS